MSRRLPPRHRDHEENSPGRIVVRYGGRAIPATSGQRLLDCILEAGIEHRHICGGHGFCTSCRVQVLSGESNLSAVSPLERQRLGREAGRLRLACQTAVEGDVHVEVARAVSSRFSPGGELERTPDGPED